MSRILFWQSGRVGVNSVNTRSDNSVTIHLHLRLHTLHTLFSSLYKRNPFLKFCRWVLIHPVLKKQKLIRSSCRLCICMCLYAHLPPTNYGCLKKYLWNIVCISWHLFPCQQRTLYTPSISSTNITASDCSGWTWILVGRLYQFLWNLVHVYIYASVYVCVFHAAWSHAKAYFIKTFRQ
jgi:hypothetical protein